ncbi:MAG: hypothetical protein GY906_28090 [bacterium]|nr:hypothetical protein [bacterium]
MIKLIPWAVPAVWTVFILIAARAGRLGFAEAVAASMIAALGLGFPRVLARSSGGLAGRAAELVVLGSALAGVLCEPSSQRRLIVVGGALAAMALTLLGLWCQASQKTKTHFTTLAGAATGIAVGLGIQGAEGWQIKALLVCLASTLTAWMLSRITSAVLAVSTSLALGAAIGPEHTLAWVLPPLVVGALWSLRARQPWLVSGLGIVCSALPPAGLILSVALTGAAARQRRSITPLLLLFPGVLLAMWRMPTDTNLLHMPTTETLALVFPLGFTCLPALLPVLLLALPARRLSAGEARDALGLGLLLLPVFAGGPFTTAVVACLWLTALPSVPQDETTIRHTTALMPWTVGASLCLLVMSPLGGATAISSRPVFLVSGLATAMILTRIPVPVFRLACILPALGLLWTTPVPGVDQHLGVGDQLQLSQSSEVGPVILVSTKSSAANHPGRPLLVGDDVPSRAIVLGTDVPIDRPSRSGHLTQVRGWGRTARHVGVGAISLQDRPNAALTATTDLIVWVEDGERWQQRHRRTLGLLIGCLATLAVAAIIAGKHQSSALDVGVVLLVAAAFATGSSVDPIATAAHRIVVDFAAAIWLAAAALILPKLHRRRVLAGMVLLLPLAMTQPLLRGPAGDEVYHLKLTESLVQDQDLALSNNLDPSRRNEAVYLKHGDELIHSPLPAVVSLPGWLIAGHAGAAVTMAFLVALGIGLAAARAEQLGIHQRAVDAAWVLSLLTYPAVTFSTSVWPAAFGIALVGIALSASARGSLTGTILTAIGGLLVKVRLGLILIPLALMTGLRRRNRGMTVLASFVAAAAAAAAAVIFLLPEGLLGRHRIAELIPHNLSSVARAGWGLLWDGAGGLAFSAPLWLVALFFLARVWRRGKHGEHALIIGAGLTVAALLPRGEWFGGGSPPARYLVPLLPLFVLALAECAAVSAGRRWIRLVLPWTAVAAWMAVTRPLHLFNPGDGGWWLADALARAYDSAALELLPTLLRPAPAALIVPILVLAAAWLWTRRQRHSAVALTLSACLILCSLAAFRREHVVHAEDPQVIHNGGQRHPRLGSFFPSAHGISWRLTDQDSITIPWHPPLGQRATARVRVDGRQERLGGRLSASWDDNPETVITLTSKGWQTIDLPHPVGLERGALHLQWEAQGKRRVDLLIDRVEVVR